VFAHSREIIDIQLNLHCCKKRACSGIIDEEGECGYSVFYRREQDKPLRRNDLWDMIEVCGKGRVEKSAYRAGTSTVRQQIKSQVAPTQGPDTKRSGDGKRLCGNHGAYHSYNSPLDSSNVIISSNEKLRFPHLVSTRFVVSLEQLTALVSVQYGKTNLFARCLRPLTRE
jgi:hypothetical protein